MDSIFVLLHASAMVFHKHLEKQLSWDISKGLPSDLVMTFGSGTGLSGYTSVLAVLFLSALGVSQGKVSIL